MPSRVCAIKSCVVMQPSRVYTRGTIRFLSLRNTPATRLQEDEIGVV